MLQRIGPPLPPGAITPVQPTAPVSTKPTQDQIRTQAAMTGAAADHSSQAKVVRDDGRQKALKVVGDLASRQNILQQAKGVSQAGRRSSPKSQFDHWRRIAPLEGQEGDPGQSAEQDSQSEFELFTEDTLEDETL